jgi:DNA adenine methylase
MARQQTKKARPFLKWAGGKRQLLPQIDSHLPAELKSGQIRRYVEPFVGSGAVFFHIVQTYAVGELFIADINAELILAYRAIQQDVDALIAELSALEEHYLGLSEEQRKTFYYRQRESFNEERTTITFHSFQPAWIRRTAQLIFFNKTCYNGLFRVNSRGEYNVPFGRYKNPTICDAPNLRSVSAILNRTRIHFGHYSDCADFYRQLDEQGAHLLLSNSDPKNINPEDDFLEEAYEGFRIERVQARRRINRSADNRGPINELLILNY